MLATMPDGSWDSRYENLRPKRCKVPSDLHTRHTHLRSHTDTDECVHKTRGGGGNRRNMCLEEPLFLLLLGSAWGLSSGKRVTPEGDLEGTRKDTRIAARTQPPHGVTYIGSGDVWPGLQRSQISALPPPSITPPLVE